MQTQQNVREGDKQGHIERHLPLYPGNQQNQTRGGFSQNNNGHPKRPKVLLGRGRGQRIRRHRLEHEERLGQQGERSEEERSPRSPTSYDTPVSRAAHSFSFASKQQNRNGTVHGNQTPQSAGASYNQRHTAYLLPQPGGYFDRRNRLTHECHRLCRHRLRSTGEKRVRRMQLRVVILRETDREFLLDNTAEGDVMQETLCPELKLTVCGLSVLCLLDSGAEKSSVAEAFISDICATGYKLPVVPISRLRIIGATTKSSPMGLGSTERILALVIEDLTRTVILGIDFLTCYKIILDFGGLFVRTADRESRTVGTPDCWRWSDQFVCHLQVADATSWPLFCGITVTLGEECSVDDILVTSATFEEHLKHLQTVLNKLTAAGMTVKLRKSLFCREEVPFLGHVLTPEGIRTAPDKLAAITEFPMPRNVRKLREFLGVVCFYRSYSDKVVQVCAPLCRCVHHCAGVCTVVQVCASLFELLRKAVTWKWTEEKQQAFEVVRELSLSYPVQGDTHYLYTGASSYALGVKLAQLSSDDIEKTVAMASRTLHKVENNYTENEKEMLGVVWALQHFRNLLLGERIVLQTDHQALICLHTGKIFSSRLTRWSLLIQEFNLGFQHIKGSENVAADYLSRIPDGAPEVENKNPNEFFVARSATQPELSSLPQEIFANVLQDQKADHFYSRVLKKLEEVTAEHPLGNSFCTSSDGVLFQRGLHQNEFETERKIVLPEKLQELLIIGTHELDGHLGIRKTYRALGRQFFWKRMLQKVTVTDNGSCVPYALTSQILVAAETPQKYNETRNATRPHAPPPTPTPQEALHHSASKRFTRELQEDTASLNAVPRGPALYVSGRLSKLRKEEGLGEEGMGRKRPWLLLRTHPSDFGKPRSGWPDREWSPYPPEWESSELPLRHLARLRAPLTAKESTGPPPSTTIMIDHDSSLAIEGDIPFRLGFQCRVEVCPQLWTRGLVGVVVSFQCCFDDAKHFYGVGEGALAMRGKAVEEGGRGSSVVGDAARINLVGRTTLHAASPRMSTQIETVAPMYRRDDVTDTPNTRARLKGGRWVSEETGDPRENPRTSDIVRYDSHMRKSGAFNALEQRTRHTIVALSACSPGQLRPLTAARRVDAGNAAGFDLGRANIHRRRRFTASRHEGRGEEDKPFQECPWSLFKCYLPIVTLGSLRYAVLPDMKATRRPEQRAALCCINHFPKQSRNGEILNKLDNPPRNAKLNSTYLPRHSQSESRGEAREGVGREERTGVRTTCSRSRRETIGLGRLPPSLGCERGGLCSSFGWHGNYTDNKTRPCGHPKGAEFNRQQSINECKTVKRVGALTSKNTPIESKQWNRSIVML
ncbi:hypothetical protein PR048_025179 [Dryococelus australis]|uniref:RNA-directed DNA polymerase n=1 Tax=Dryococelus australis TaxID=614101 RepID=A0ABQ9GQQ1_9NEOP|nr:hypothetical protein PR048_025179 [Dryococelus australis]